MLTRSSAAPPKEGLKVCGAIANVPLHAAAAWLCVQRARAIGVHARPYLGKERLHVAVWPCTTGTAPLMVLSFTRTHTLVAGLGVYVSIVGFDDRLL